MGHTAAMTDGNAQINIYLHQASKENTTVKSIIADWKTVPPGGHVATLKE
jgi:hypothetical protein